MLSRVELSSSAYLNCLCHALSTEKEEVMGLLLGDWEEENTNTPSSLIVAKITCVSILTRSDKKKDRVEISPEQLAAASAEADISEQTSRRVRVIGWYHSHPHITVHPSHVDIQTQAMYQMLDKGFVGLIFSCFHKEANKSGKIQVTAFQSVEKNKSSSNTHPDLIELNDSMDSKTDTEYAGLHKKASGFEAIEIPLYIDSAHSTAVNTLDKLVSLQEILYGEEKAAYSNSLKPYGLDVHPLVQMHNTAVYQKSLCRLLELETLPILRMLQQRHKQNLEKQLKEEKQRLELRVRSKKAKN